MNARADLTVDRKQRLLALEAQIREGYEAFVRIGFALKEIRDDHLYEEAGFPSWDEYLRRRVGQDFGIRGAQARRLIVSAQVRLKLPGPPSDTAVSENKADAEWTQKAVYEFARLAPRNDDAHGQPYDLDRLDRRDVERVAGKVIEHCKKENVRCTPAVVRRFVDGELGIDRVAQAAETRKKREEQYREMDRQREEREHPDISQHLINRVREDGREAERVRDLVKEIGEEGWERWKYDRRGLMVQVLAGMTTLTDLYEVEGNPMTPAGRIERELPKLSKAERRQLARRLQEIEEKENPR
jgi:hypothetical protein